MTLGQGWLIFDLTGSPLLLGYLGAAAAVPGILVTLIGGVIADRFNKRILVLWTSGSTTLLLATLASLVFSGLVEVWHVLTIAAAVSFITGVDWPVRTAFYPLLVRRQAYLSAVALNAFIWQSTRTAIPAVGGLLILFGGTGTVFAVGALGFFIMFLTMLTIRIDASAVNREDQSPLHDLAEGIRFILQTRLFRWTIFLTFAGMFFVHSHIHMMPVFVELLEGDETMYGFLLAAGGAGSVIGTIAIGGMRRNRRMGSLLLGGALASTICTFLFALAANYSFFWIALSLAFLAAITHSFFQISGMTALQLAVPQQLRGRVMGIYTICYNLLPLGGLFLGAIASRTSILIAVATGCGIYMASVILATITQRTLRILGRRPIRELPYRA